MIKKTVLVLMLAMILAMTGCKDDKPVAEMEKDIVQLSKDTFQMKKGQVLPVKNTSKDPDGDPIKYTWYFYKLDNDNWELLGENSGNKSMSMTAHKDGVYQIGLCVIDELGAVGCNNDPLKKVLEDHSYYELYKSYPDMKELIPRNKPYTIKSGDI